VHLVHTEGNTGSIPVALIQFLHRARPSLRRPGPVLSA
jgi:hypothetical protein